MSTKEILEQALKLKPEERFMVVEGLLKSLDEPDQTLDNIWTEEQKKGLKHTGKGDLKGFQWRKYSMRNNESHIFKIWAVKAK